MHVAIRCGIRCGNVTFHVRFDFAKKNRRRIGRSISRFCTKLIRSNTLSAKSSCQTKLFYHQFNCILQASKPACLYITREAIVSQNEWELESKRMWISKELLKEIRKAQLIRVLLHRTPNEDNIVHGRKTRWPVSRRSFIDVRQNLQLIYFWSQVQPQLSDHAPSFLLWSCFSSRTLSNDSCAPCQQAGSRQECFLAVV